MTTQIGTTVAVIGNGPVGQTTALLLARWGLDVVVLDGRPHRDLIGSKAIVQQRDVLDVWDSLGGAGAEIAAEGLTWVRARTFYRGEELFCVDFQDGGQSPFPPFVNISQTRTEEILDTRMSVSPLIDVRWDHRVEGIQQDAAGVTLRCETTNGPVEVRAAYVVACAGARGDVIRSELGVSFDGRTFGDQFLICDIRTEIPVWEQERRFYFDPPWNPGRQILIHPCPDSTFRIDWQVPEDFDIAAEEADGRLDARIRQIIGEADYEIVWKSAYRFHQRVVDRMRVGRVLLAGDVAHLVAPFGARGLNSGVQDAENAAWKIAYVVAGWADEKLLDSYHLERHDAALENLAVTGATMDFLVPQTPAQHQFRQEALEQAGDQDAARASVDSGRLAEPFWYVDSPLTTTAPHRSFGGRPPKGTVPPPAPGVLVPDHPISVDGEPDRLRHLVRAGTTLLCGRGVNVDALHGALSTTGGPTAVLAVDHLGEGVAEALGVQQDEVWVIRPDGHLAATLREPDEPTVRSAVARALGQESQRT